MTFALSQKIGTRFWEIWQSASLRGVASTIWSLFWMQFAGLGFFGRIATWLAGWFAPPFYARQRLANYNPKGYIAPSATIHADLQLGDRVFVGDRVMIFGSNDGGSVELGDRVRLYDDNYIQTGEGGSVKIGAGTCVQPRCQFSAYKGSIQIGSNVLIAPSCAFYPYAHGIAVGELISQQPLQTKGGIIIEDDVWLGFGVIVLDGVRIGKGAVVGAGAVVTHDVPDGAIAMGVPARVVKMRGHFPSINSQDSEGNQRATFDSANFDSINDTPNLDSCIYPVGST